MRRLLAASTALLALAALAGCGEQEESVPQRAPSDVPGSSETSSHASSGPSSDADPTPECTADDVTAAYVAGDAATMHRFGAILVTNTSADPCLVQGYGGLSYVGDGDGEQVGAAAERDDSTPAEPVVLEPGQSASSGISETVTGAYPDGECGATEVDGFRLYLPDETHSLFVEHATDTCANADLQLLTHQAFAPA